MDTHNKLITFGQYEGQRWTRLPVSYLRYLANETRGDSKKMAEAELSRRGSLIPKGEVELSGHSIDRASMMLTPDDWGDKGLHSYLYELSVIAYTFTKKEEGDEKVDHDGWAFVFKHGSHYPILKTFMRGKKKKTHA